MRSFLCQCSNTIFFENNQCTACLSSLGWCPGCQTLTALVPVNDDQYRCGNIACGTLLKKCINYSDHNVCNRCVQVSNTVEPTTGFCDYCRYNDTIPDLTISDNWQKWLRLEVAKRRLMYTLDRLRLPYGNTKDGISPPLSFDFKGDVIEKSLWWWRTMGKEERVFTGHAGGKITINIREADHVEREKARVSFDEAHRTIIGHFRHEIGHYYWEMLVMGRCETAFIATFGDHNLSYTDAMQKHYENGAKDNWQINYISAYATMHPWEDFAETFATYLDIVSVLDTAMNMGLGDGLDPCTAPIEQMIKRYCRLGVILNEMNRSMGLIDLAPDILAGPIEYKLAFIHHLLRNNAKPVSPSLLNESSQRASQR
ncbi:MAG: hypothetical protein ACI8PP_003156 [Candidatus Pseudothioglobus sp.]|jgi:hypothetical protein